MPDSLDQGYRESLRPESYRGLLEPLGFFDTLGEVADYQVRTATQNLFMLGVNEKLNETRKKWEDALGYDPLPPLAGSYDPQIRRTMQSPIEDYRTLEAAWRGLSEKDQQKINNPMEDLENYYGQLREQQRRVAESLERTSSPIGVSVAEFGLGIGLQFTDPAQAVLALTAPEFGGPVLGKVVKNLVFDAAIGGVVGGEEYLTVGPLQKEAGLSRPGFLESVGYGAAFSAVGSPIFRGIFHGAGWLLEKGTDRLLEPYKAVAREVDERATIFRGKDEPLVGGKSEPIERTFREVSEDLAARITSDLEGGKGIGRPGTNGKAERAALPFFEEPIRIPEDVLREVEVSEGSAGEAAKIILEKFNEPVGTREQALEGFVKELGLEDKEVQRLLKAFKKHDMGQVEEVLRKVPDVETELMARDLLGLEMYRDVPHPIAQAVRIKAGDKVYIAKGRNHEEAVAKLQAKGDDIRKHIDQDSYGYVLKDGSYISEREFVDKYKANPTDMVYRLTDQEAKIRDQELSKPEPTSETLEQDIQAHDLEPEGFEDGKLSEEAQGSLGEEILNEPIKEGTLVELAGEGDRMDVVEGAKGFKNFGEYFEASKNFFKEMQACIIGAKGGTE